MSPMLDHEAAKAAKLAWKRNNIAKGLCGICNRPGAVGKDGRLIARCEYHRMMRKGWVEGKYSPPPGLLPINYFSCFPPTDLAYAAALIEGEGCFRPDTGGSTGRRPYPAIMLSMTDKEPVQWMYDTFGGNFCYRLPKFRTWRQPQWAWSVNGRRAGALAAAIHRYLKSQRRKTPCLMVVKTGSICGWWRSNRLDSHVDELLRKLKYQANQWRARGHLENR